MLPTFFFLSVHNFGPLLHLSYYVLSLKWWVICTLECARILDLGLEIFDTFPRALKAWTKANHSNHVEKGEIVSTWSPSFPRAFYGFCPAIAVLLSSMEILHQSFQLSLLCRLLADPDFFSVNLCLGPMLILVHGIDSLLEI